MGQVNVFASHGRVFTSRFQALDGLVLLQDVTAGVGFVVRSHSRLLVSCVTVASEGARVVIA